MRISMFVGVLISLVMFVAFVAVADDTNTGQPVGLEVQEVTLDAFSLERLLDLTKPEVTERLEFTPPIVVAQCCKICRKGKACGNSCISRGYTCRKPPGCACDG